MDKVYDLIIIGAGPAGLSASIYASRYKLDHLVIGNEIGGQALEAWEIENYPGFEKITGKDLMEKMKMQAEKLGGKMMQTGIVKIEKKEDCFEVTSTNNEKFISRTIIFALGMKPRKANIPNEENFIGKGVSYCATCDAMFFRGKDVVVFGGGDSAATAALHLADFANKVIILYRGEQVRFEPAWMEKIEKNSKIEIVLNSIIKGINGDSKVAGISYEQKGETKELVVQGLFIEVGTVPGVSIAKDLGAETDDQDYIVVDQTQKTNLKNVYAAGDVTTNSNKFRQIITAAAEGAVAASSVYKEIKLKK